MTVVVEHLANRGRSRKDANGVVSGTAFYHVRSLSAEAGGKLPEALNAVDIPQPGADFTPYPGAVVTGLSSQSQKEGTTDHVLVELSYSTDPEGVSGSALSLSDPREYAYRTVTVTDQTIFDVNDVQMKVTWTNFSTTTITQTATAEIERAAVVIDITRTTAFDPIWLNDTWTGTVNDGPWGPYSADQVRCDGFTAVGSSENQGLWRVTGTFFPSPAVRGDWLFEVYVRQGWYVPEDVTVNNGIAIFNVYPRADFSPHLFTLP